MLILNQAWVQVVISLVFQLDHCHLRGIMVSILNLPFNYLL